MMMIRESKARGKNVKPRFYYYALHLIAYIEYFEKRNFTRKKGRNLREYQREKKKERCLRTNFISYVTILTSNESASFFCAVTIIYLSKVCHCYEILHFYFIHSRKLYTVAKNKKNEC